MKDPELRLVFDRTSVQTYSMDPDFEDLIEKAFLEGQIDGETMELSCILINSPIAAISTRH